jgi:hypothetical protein
MTLLINPVGSLVACRTYLRAELDDRGNDLPIEVRVPAGAALGPYALLSRVGGTTRGFLVDHLLRVRVFDADMVRLEANVDLLHRLMLEVMAARIDTERGAVFITGATPQLGPSELNDPDIPLPGMQFAVFWTIGLRREGEAIK